MFLSSNQSMESLSAGITSLFRPQKNPSPSNGKESPPFDEVSSCASYSTATNHLTITPQGSNSSVNHYQKSEPPEIPIRFRDKYSAHIRRTSNLEHKSVISDPPRVDDSGNTSGRFMNNRKKSPDQLFLHDSCPSPSSSVYSPTHYSEAKQSFTSTTSDRVSSVEEISLYIRSTTCTSHADFLDSSRRTSLYRASTFSCSSSDLTDESSSGPSTTAVVKPHKAANNDIRWEAIRDTRARYGGSLGLNHFRVLSKVGGGDIGKVYLSELAGTGTYFAMKVMDKADLEGRKKVVRARAEREILECLDHPFLPTLYTTFETERLECLVMEFCPGGDLHAVRQRRPGKCFCENASRFYVAEVLLALEYLHMLGIVYRDLKPENVLVREDGHIMLSDFDLSLRCAVSPTIVRSSNSNTVESKSCIDPVCVAIQPDCLRPVVCFSPRFFSSKSSKKKKKNRSNLQKSDHHTTTNQQQTTRSTDEYLPELVAEPTSARSMSFVGTHEYLAPEIIKGEGHGSAVDWWTLGIFLYELLFGQTPFRGNDNRSTLFNVVSKSLKFPATENVVGTVGFAARDLIRGLLVKDPQQRLGYRRGAVEIKQHPFFHSVNWALVRCATPPLVPEPFVSQLGSGGGRAGAPPAAAKLELKPAGNYYEIDLF